MDPGSSGTVYNFTNFTRERYKMEKMQEGVIQLKMLCKVIHIILNEINRVKYSKRKIKILDVLMYACIYSICIKYESLISCQDACVHFSLNVGC